MPIPEAQLDTWSHQGAIQGSSNTYNTVKGTLEAAGSPYEGKNYSVFLQGSYGNDTNIFAESDVDVVICLNDCFQSDQSKLTEEEKAAWKKVHSDATYTHVDFKRDVLKVLTDKFGAHVDAGQKAILIESHGNRRKTDVITAIQYRRYFKFSGINDQSYEEGICFYTSSGLQIANYPKQHRANLTKKHQDANSWVKPMIRVMKNLRAKLVDDSLLKPGVAPSYFIEGLLYNVPVESFHTDYQTCFFNVFTWLQKDAKKADLLCANEQYYLLREGFPNCWPADHCEQFITASISCWNDWK